MEKSLKKLNDSPLMRWGALGVVAFTMMAAYFVNDIMAPLQGMLHENIGWTGSEFGFFTGAYSILNVLCLMLIWGGLILDKFGIRFTGILAAGLMVVGTAIQYYGITELAESTGMLFGYKSSVGIASLGYAIFGVGAEVAGITVTKAIAKWFNGKEMATAMGLQVALARIGSQAAYAFALPIARSMQLSTPVLIGLCLLVVGLVAFIVFSMWDKKLDKQINSEVQTSDEENFSFSDVVSVLKNPGFWLIAILCVLFYSCIFPFQKFATTFMIQKYGVSENLAGFIAGSPALGALILTPIFGYYIDKVGRAASIMMLGSGLLIVVHAIYALPMIDNWVVAIILMVILGVAFSLVPSAMWPSVAKIFPARQLGTAYALIFFIQNIGLFAIPLLIGTVLHEFCIVSAPGEPVEYSYTLPMLIFTGIAVTALIVSFALKAADKKYGYNLENKNIKQ